MIDLRVPATVDGMETVHGALATCCSTLARARSLESRWSHEFTLAVAEVAANIIQHAHDPETPVVQFALSLTRYPDRLVARFVDRGVVASSSSTAAMPSVEMSYADLGERGRGLALVQATADRFEYQRTRDGENIWVIEKDFPA
jgi:serine/threonine-protein kinase RsbW